MRTAAEPNPQTSDSGGSPILAFGQGEFASLYVHFPFCETKCHYCDFYSLGRERTRDTDSNQFEAALLREATISAPELASRIDTIFFGGGTPSMTPPQSMVRALKPLNLFERIHDGTEWTMEANPSSVDIENLKGYRALGVNRVSMGVQAMNDELLLKLGRVHSRDQALKALDAIFGSGITNASVDLLCGVPGQTLEHLEKAIDALTQFPIRHLSCYLLTLPPHHKMFADLPKEEEQLEHLLFIDQAMKSRGFGHYEISNYAKPGFEARHNLAYWKGHAYLGLGPSAHSFSSKKRMRWKNFSSLHKWASTLEKASILSELPREQTEHLNSDQENLERWLLALRLDEGFPEAWLDTDLRRNRAQRLLAEGILEAHPQRSAQLRLTAKGMALSDSVIQALS